MAFDLRVAVKKGLVDLRRTISKKSLELAALRNELAKYRTVQGVLAERPEAGRTGPNGNSRRKPLDWNSVLRRLPGSFAVGNVANLANSKSKTYMHHVVAKWVKQRKVKRVERGKYQKL